MRRALLSGGQSRSRIHADRVARWISLIRVLPYQTYPSDDLPFPLDRSAREWVEIRTHVPGLSGTKQVQHGRSRT